MASTGHFTAPSVGRGIESAAAVRQLVITGRAHSLVVGDEFLGLDLFLGVSIQGAGRR